MRILIYKSQKGDKEAFTELIALNRQSMYKVARAYLSQPEDIDDALSEAVMRCWKNISTLKHPEYFKTWLIRILINCCKEQLRTSKKYISLDEVNPSDIPYSQDEGNISDIIGMADERYRLVLLLYYGEDFKVKEISEITGLPVRTVSSHLKRGREQLAQKLREEGIL